MEPSCQLTQPCTQRGLERRQKILNAAKTVFIEQGYANASINEIVRLSGGSLGTIYRFFGNKLGLFEAFFQQMTHEVFSHFETQVLKQGDIETNLMSFGRQMQRLMFEHDALAIYRLVLTEQSADKADIQRIFFENGPKKLNRILSHYFEQQVQTGRLQIADCDIAAYQFIDMLKGPYHFQAMFGQAVSQEECERTLAQAVSLFLHGARVQKHAE